MRQMGLKMTELQNVQEVVIRLPDREIVITDAQVSLLEMSGQRTYQIIGEEHERKRELEISEEDIKLVMDQANVSHDSALQALKENNGDIAQAIIKLKGAE